MNIGIFGNYGHSNIGDEAILRGLLTLLKGHDITVFSDNISMSRAVHGKRPRFVLSRPVLKGRWYLLPVIFLHLVKNILSVKTVVIGGGGLFNDINRSAFLQYVLLICLSKLFFRKVYILGVSVGPLKNSWMIIALWYVSFLTERVCVRDESSVKFFRIAEVIPDLAMGAEVFTNHQSDKDSYEVVISAMSIKASQNNLVQESYREELEALIDYLVVNNTEVSIKLLAMDFERDLDELRSIERFCLAKSLQCEIIPALSFEILEGAFQSCDLVIATRLHAAILAQLYECPYMSIAYQEKVSNYMTSHGLARSCATIDAKFRFNLHESFKNINRDLQEIKTINFTQKHKLRDFVGEIK